MKSNYWSRTELALAMGLALGLMTGCHDPGEPGHEHDPAPAESDHAHEEQTHQVTAWSDLFEIFAEFEPVAAGQAFDLVAHVTSRETRAPRTEGPLRLTLRRGDQIVERLEAQPARPGIYILELSLDEPGAWETTIEIPGPDGGSTVVMPAIEVHADAHEAAHAEVAAVPEGIHFLKEQQWKIRMGTELITRRPLVERLVFPARAIAKPGADVMVVAPLAGQLVEPAGEPFPRLGQRVEAGQVLARLEPKFSEAATRMAEVEAERVQARTALDQAQIGFDRVQRLAAEQAKSQRELQEAEAALLTARSRLDAVMALRSTYRQLEGALATGSTSLPAVDLRAPISGIINRIDAGAGEVVGSDSTIFQVIDPEVVWLEARIPEGSVTRLRAAADPLYERLDDLGHYRGIEDSAGMFIGFEVDAATRTVPLTVEVRNPEHRLRVGQSIRLHLATARAEEALALPETAIVEEAGRPVVFVQLSGEMFERREVILGIRDGGWVQLIEGVGEGERVVTDGAYVLRLASLSSALPTHGHAH